MKSSTTSFSSMLFMSKSLSNFCVLPKKSGPESLNSFHPLSLMDGLAKIWVLCFHAKESADMMVPATTAWAKSSTTVIQETRTMMAVSSLGILPNNLRLDQLKVCWQTRSIIPTKAAMGICPKRGAAATMPVPRARDIDMPASLLLPPLSTFMRDCPINAHPPIPPVSPLKKLPRPWPRHSLLVLPLLPSSTMPSTSWSVRRLSIKPTVAMVRA
mmetsp:Transcript_816/g.1418  ORF Transcript_816/g.1418 Transcript_816/m.1418 type:complete len:214 (+) Transcript_816:291-932(+)